VVNGKLKRMNRSAKYCRS